MPTPTGWSATSKAQLTGRADVNSLIDGQRWASAAISYSFAGPGSSWSTDPNAGYGPRTDTSSEPWSAGFAALSADNRAAVRSALGAWANVSGLRFTEVTESAASVGDLRFAFTNLPNAQAWAYTPGDAPAAGDVWFNTRGTSRTAAWTPGSYEYMTALHEIGHALGLKHPFEAGSGNAVRIPTAQDSRSYTVMSYSALPGRTGTWFSFEPTTPMLLDVAAMQALYGPNRQYKAGNDVYAFSGTASYHQTIWDGGGTDTLRYDSASGGLLDLREGQASRLGQSVDIYGSTGVLQRGVNNVWIAYGTVIENATGGSGADQIIGNAAANTLQGGAGNDTLDGGAGNDVLDGGADVDTATYASATAAVSVSLLLTAAQNTGGAGTDTLTAIENLTGSAFNDKLTGNAGANVLLGDAGNDSLLGGAGNDTLDGGLGNDVLDGGADTDTASYASATTAVTVSLLSTAAQNTGGAGTDTLTAIENLTGSAFNDRLTGNTGANVLQGGAGNDALLGDAGNDTLQGDAGSDTLEGGAGNDLLDGGADADTASYAAATGAVSVSLLLTAAQNTGGAGTDTLTAIENLTGSAFNDSLTGNTGANVLQGGTGNDLLLGDAGNDTLQGGAGADTLDGGLGNDALDGGADIDTATYALATAAVTVSLLSTAAQNTGGAGTDTLAAIENLTGSAFNDKLTGNAGANLLQGGGGSDTLLGDGGNDTLDGGAGNDTLTGGAGLDSLTGGAGADVFDFNVLAESGATATTCDLITDFSAAQGDRIDLRDVDADTARVGVQHFSGFIDLKVKFSLPGQLHFDAATGLFTANTDGDADAEFALKLTGVSSLGNGNFWLS